MRMTARYVSRALRRAARFGAWRRLALAGCSETIGSLSGPNAKVAEIEPDTTGAARGNIASLSDVIQRNPDRSGRLQHPRHRLRQDRAISRPRSRISPRRSNSIRISPAPTPIARSPIARPRRTGRRSPTSTRPSPPIPTTPPPISGAAICCARRAIFPRRSPISTMRSGSIRGRAGLSCARPDLSAPGQPRPRRSPTSTTRSIAIRSPRAPYQARGQSLLATGKYDAAIEDFNAALNVNANNADAWASLGIAYEKLGNKSKAVESYNRAMQVNPRNPAARAGLQRLS